MAAVNPPNWLQTELHPSDRDRQLIKSLVRPGVLPGTGLTVTEKSGTPNMSVDVSEGRLFILGTENTYQGVYHGEAQGVTNVVIAAADPTNPRRDLIVARIRDSVYSGATNTFSIERVAGTPAGSPADPALPSGSVWVLARVAVAAAATSITNANITSFRAGGTGYTGQHGYAAALGGVVVCTSLTKPTTGLYEGLMAYETDTDRVIVYNGSAWVGQTVGASATVSTSQSTASGAFVDLATVGPAVSIFTGSKAVVWVHVRCDNGSGGGWCLMSAAATDIGFGYQSPSGGNFHKGAAMIEFTGLTPGVNTFTAKYSAGVGTATFADRRIAAMPTL